MLRTNIVESGVKHQNPPPDIEARVELVSRWPGTDPFSSNGVCSKKISGVIILSGDLRTRNKHF